MCLCVCLCVCVQPFRLIELSNILTMVSSHCCNPQSIRVIVASTQVFPYIISAGLSAMFCNCKDLINLFIMIFIVVKKTHVFCTYLSRMSVKMWGEKNEFIFNRLEKEK